MSHMFTISYLQTQVYPCGLGVCWASRAAAVPNKAHPRKADETHTERGPGTRGCHRHSVGQKRPLFKALI